ncbi:unnamed protein product [Debaryomyces fabryi]|nr:unnamed protein product [Debaryomyces fabryi]
MELINHIGITSTSENVTTSIISRLRGCFILLFLFAASFLYKFISTICLSLHYLLPESINNIKRLSASMFWELCIYFLVCIINNRYMNSTDNYRN